MATIDVGRLPVVATHDHGPLVGLVRRSDVRFFEVRVTPDSAVTAQRVRDQPSRTILTRIRRRGEGMSC